MQCKVFIFFASCSICMLLGGSGQISERPAHYLLHTGELDVYREAYRMRSNIMNQTSSGLPIILNFLDQRANKVFLPPNHHIYWCFIHRRRSWKMAFVHLTWVAFRRFLTLILKKTCTRQILQILNSPLGANDNSLYKLFSGPLNFSSKFKSLPEYRIAEVGPELLNL